ncbi:hypothetical protein BD779DRAFT_50376 [Infundibulicybe gibba]|nr:hypothetical protein BD779DRAFT_50376 [Infundibulicybe gibba]
MSTDDTSCPLVIVQGFLCPGAALWGNLDKFLNPSSSGTPRRRIIFAQVGPVSSLHDRACELYFALRGGTVDYGAGHSEVYGHARYGRTHSQGLYPQWSRHKPLHFLGHSIGGPTIVKLQDLMKTGYFGPDAHADMVLSINTISAPFRGTQLVYSLGERVDAAPAVRPLSIGSVIAKSVHLISFLSPLLPAALDLHAESRALSFRDISVPVFLKQLWRSDWAEGKDSTPYDVTFLSADERELNGEGRTNPNTFYRSHVASLDNRGGWRHLFLRPFILSPWRISSWIIGTFDFQKLNPAPSFLLQRQMQPKSGEIGFLAPAESGAPEIPQLGEEYRANDGVVPVFSQWHPLSCVVTSCRHHEHPSNSVSRDRLLPGIWNVHEIENASHISVAPIWFSNPQKEYWRDLGQWLKDIDMWFTSKPLQHAHPLGSNTIYYI